MKSTLKTINTIPEKLVDTVIAIPEKLTNIISEIIPENIKTLFESNETPLQKKKEHNEIKINTELDSKLVKAPMEDNEVIIVDNPDEPDTLEEQTLSLMTNVEKPKDKDVEDEKLIKKLF